MGGTEKMVEYARQTFRVTTVALLLFLLSGFLPFTMQCYAWVQMAKDAGGVEMLGRVVTQDPPCELCSAASDLQNQQTGKGDKSCPENRLEVHKSLYTLEITNLILTSKTPPRNLAGVGFTRWSARLPRQLANAPETPPPELIPA